MYREKKIYSGKILEVELYPVYKSGREIPRRAKKEKLSTKEQKNLNDKNARKKLTRLINANFGEGDIVIHPTYRDSEMPSTEQEARSCLLYTSGFIYHPKKESGINILY